MCCKSWKAVFPFALTFLIGLLITNFVQNILESKNDSDKSVKGVFLTKLTEDVTSNQVSTERTLCPSRGNATPMMILFKPSANYTESARINRTQGTITLRVNLLANGEIGRIKVINYLPDGLTEEAIKAAKQIKFKPANNNDGKPVNVVSQLQYTFTLY